VGGVGIEGERREGEGGELVKTIAEAACDFGEKYRWSVDIVAEKLAAADFSRRRFSD